MMRRSGYPSYPLHRFAPRLWRKTHQITGDYVFDASIEFCRNPSVPGKINMHCSNLDSYGPRTAYSGYTKISGDD